MELVKSTQPLLKTAKSGFESLFASQQNIIKSFQYLKAVKHGSIKELEAAVIKAESTGKSADEGCILRYLQMKGWNCSL